MNKALCSLYYVNRHLDVLYKICKICFYKNFFLYFNFFILIMQELISKNEFIPIKRSKIEIESLMLNSQWPSCFYFMNLFSEERLPFGHARSSQILLRSHLAIEIRTNRQNHLDFYSFGNLHFCQEWCLRIGSPKWGQQIEVRIYAPLLIAGSAA